MLVLCAEVLKLICIKFILIFNIMGINTFSFLLRVPKLEVIDNVILLYYVTPKKPLPTSTTAKNVTSLEVKSIYSVLRCVLKIGRNLFIFCRYIIW